MRDGKYVFSVLPDGYSGYFPIEVLAGAFSFSENEIVIEYESLQHTAYEQQIIEFEFTAANALIRRTGADSGQFNFTVFLPTHFTIASDEAVGKAMYDMPLYKEEIVLPFSNTPTPCEVESALGKPLVLTFQEGPPKWAKAKYQGTEMLFTVHENEKGKEYGHSVIDFLLDDSGCMTKICYRDAGY